MRRSCVNNRIDNYQLAELFLVAADVNRTFVASMLTRYDIDIGEEFVMASVKIVEGEVVSAGADRNVVEINLDTICKMKLDYGLHTKLGKSSNFSLNKIHHN